jgi:hypothetical protein
LFSNYYVFKDLPVRPKAGKQKRLIQYGLALEPSIYEAKKEVKYKNTLILQKKTPD